MIQYSDKLLIHLTSHLSPLTLMIMIICCKLATYLRTP